MTLGKYYFVGPAILIATLLNGCSGSQQQQGDAEPVNAQSENGAPVANSSLNGNNSKKAAEGEAMNNATAPSNNFAGDANAAPPNNAMLGNPGANPTGGNGLVNGGAAEVPLNQSAPLGTNNLAAPANGTVPTNAAAPANGAAPTNGTNPTATAATPAAPAPGITWDRMGSSPMTNPQMNWPGRGKVKYVTRRATKHASPNGPVVGEMETGEHPLVYQDGNWVELSNGTFMKGNSMSDKGVGYERSR